MKQYRATETTHTCPGLYSYSNSAAAAGHIPRMTNGGRAYALPPFSFGPSSASRPTTTRAPPPSQRPDQPPFLPPPSGAPGRAHACRCYPYSITEVNIKLEFICGWCFCENYGQPVRHVADTFFDTLLPPHPVCGRPSEGLRRSYLRLRLRMKQRQVVRQSKHRR